MGGMVIDKYSVAVSKNRANLKVTSRQIVLDAPDGWSDSFNNIKISFFEEDEPNDGHDPDEYHDPNDMGFQTPGGPVVYVYLPFRDFDHMYHLLQTEKPLSASWNIDSDYKLVSFKLYTSLYAVDEVPVADVPQEPLGEGLRDYTG